MSENKQKKGLDLLKTRANIGIIVIMFIAVMAFVGLLNHIASTKTALNESNKSLAICLAKETDIETDIETDCDINNDSLLQRDIEFYITARYTRVPKVVAKSIAENILLYSAQYDISPELVTGIIEVESRFNPMVISKKDARGLMQVMPEWAPKFKIKVNDLHDIDVGIESGIKVFLIHLGEAKGSISKALYYYVGKDKTYSDYVYTSVGRFVSFRSTINDKEKIAGKEKNSDRIIKRAANDIKRNTSSDNS